MKVRVYHDYYGCDTGCCGHTVEIDDGEGKFEFDHPYGEDRESFAKALAMSVIKHKFPECADSLDWANVEFDYDAVRDC